jgi:tellurite resistance protein
MNEPPAQTPAFRHLPLPLFAVPMGLGGLGLAWREAGRTLGAPAVIGEVLLAVTAITWLLIVLLHALRAVRHPEALLADLRHPIRASFAGAVTIGLMLIAAGAAPIAPALAATIWVIAVVLHLAIGVWTVRGLLLAPREQATLAPPLLIPLVGNILAPVMGVKLGFVLSSWMMFGLGALLWVLIQPLILARLIHGPALPPRLRPSLAILLAPPAVASIALANLTGGFGAVPLAVLGLALFVAMVLLTLARSMAQGPFAMSWWSWTFPPAAFSVAVMAATHAHPAPWQPPLLWLLLAAVSTVVALVGGRTLQAAASGELLRPEG